MCRVEVIPIESVVCTQVECKCCVVCGCETDKYINFTTLEKSGSQLHVWKHGSSGLTKEPKLPYQLSLFVAVT